MQYREMFRQVLRQKSTVKKIVLESLLGMNNGRIIQKWWKDICV